MANTLSALCSRMEREIPNLLTAPYTSVWDGILSARRVSEADFYANPQRIIQLKLVVAFCRHEIQSTGSDLVKEFVKQLVIALHRGKHLSVAYHYEVDQVIALGLDCWLAYDITDEVVWEMIGTRLPLGTFVGIAERTGYTKANLEHLHDALLRTIDINLVVWACNLLLSIPFGDLPECLTIIHDEFNSKPIPTKLPDLVPCIGFYRLLPLGGGGGDGFQIQGSSATKKYKISGGYIFMGSSLGFIHTVTDVPNHPQLRISPAIVKVKDWSATSQRGGRETLLKVAYVGGGEGSWKVDGGDAEIRERMSRFGPESM